MSTNTSIEWTEATWNPIRGCSRVSEGCRNCYAERVAARFSGPGQPYEGLAKWRTIGGPECAVATHPEREPQWTGEVRFIEERLTDPFRWSKPKRIFVNSMSDLFHEKVKDEWIAEIFSIMARTPQHVYQILTKRPERMRQHGRCNCYSKPLPNVWLGVSVEDQKTADERIPPLLETPAAVRWVSYEPALGPVDFRFSDRLHWIVIGGESGPGARPFDIQWARDVIAQCKAAGVPCFVKQLGSAPVSVADKISHKGYREHIPDGLYRFLNDRKGGDPREWPEDLRVREYPK